MCQNSFRKMRGSKQKQCVKYLAQIPSDGVRESRRNSVKHPSDEIEGRQTEHCVQTLRAKFGEAIEKLFHFCMQAASGQVRPEPEGLNQ